MRALPVKLVGNRQVYSLSLLVIHHSCLTNTHSPVVHSKQSITLTHSPMIHDVMVREEGTVIRDLPRDLPVVRGGEVDTSAGLQP